MGLTGGGGLNSLGGPGASIYGGRIMMGTDWPIWVAGELPPAPPAVSATPVTLVCGTATGVAGGATVALRTPNRYRDAILSDGAALFWRANETAGTVAEDMTANSRDGTYVGAPTLGGTGALAGDIDARSVALNGFTQWITSSYQPFANGSSRSFEGWATLTNSSSGRVLFSNDTGDIMARVNSGTTDVGFWSNTGAANVSWASAWPATGPWVHWVITFNDATDTAELFINGVSKGTRSLTAAYVSTTGVFVAGARPGVEAWLGSMEEVAVYEAILTPTQILNHYLLGRSLVCQTAAGVAIGGNVVLTVPSAGLSCGTAAGVASATAVLRTPSYWAPVGTTPLSDAAAAALVVHVPEQIFTNVAANNYVPTTPELNAYYAGTPSGWTNFNLVTGKPGLTNPSTDDLIQWAAAKWGIPVDWVRAAAWYESQYPGGVGPAANGWYQSSMGDLATVANSALYPPQARVDPTHAYESMGITSVKWRPGATGLSGDYTEPLRWESTAFNLDFWAANVRYYFDGYCAWCTGSYSSGQEWESIGAWFSPNPWPNAGRTSYIASVQSVLIAKPWTALPPLLLLNPAVATATATAVLTTPAGANLVCGTAAGAASATLRLSASLVPGTATGVATATASLQAPHSMYAQLTLDDSALAYIRLGERSGTFAGDSSGNGHNGTYDGAPALGQTDALVGDGDTAASFVAASSQDVTLDTLGSFGSGLLGTWTLEFWLKTTDTGLVSVTGTVNTGTALIWGLQLNQGALGTLDATSIGVHIRDQVNGKQQFWVPASSGSHMAAAFDGNWHYHVWTMSTWPTMDYIFDGQPIGASTLGPGGGGSLTTAANFGFPVTLAARNNRGTLDQRGTMSLDEVALYTTAMTRTRALQKYQAALTGGMPLLCATAVASATATLALQTVSPAVLVPGTAAGVASGGNVTLITGAPLTPTTAVAVASATLSLTVAPKLVCSTAVASASATLVLSVVPLLVCSTATAVASTRNLILGAWFGTAAATASTSLAMSTGAPLALGAAVASASATLALQTVTGANLVCGTAAGVATAANAAIVTGAPLSATTAVAVATATLTLSVAPILVCSTATAVASTRNLILGQWFGAATGVASATLSLLTVPLLICSTATGVASTRNVILGQWFGAAAGVASTTLTLTVRPLLVCSTATGVASATLVLTSAGALVKTASFKAGTTGSGADVTLHVESSSLKAGTKLSAPKARERLRLGRVSAGTRSSVTHVDTQNRTSSFRARTRLSGAPIWISTQTHTVAPENLELDTPQVSLVLDARPIELALNGNSSQNTLDVSGSDVSIDRAQADLVLDDNQVTTELEAEMTDFAFYY